MTKFNVASAAQKIGSSDKETEILNAGIVEFLKANPKSEKQIQADYMAGYISGKLGITLEKGRQMLTRPANNTNPEKNPDRRTDAEQKVFNTSKGLFARLRDRAGLKDQAKSAAKKDSVKAKTEKTEKTEVAPKPESKIPVYKKPDELVTYNVLHLADLSKVNDANAVTVKNSELLQKIARIVRDAKAEIDRAIKNA